MTKTYNAKLVPMEGKSEIQQQVTHPENIQVVTPEWLESYTGNNWQAQRLVITDETPYQDIKGGYVLCPDGVSVANVIGYEADLKKYWCVVSGAKCFIDGSDYKKVISAYPTIPDVPQIDLSDIRRWISDGCKESVELEMDIVYGSYEDYEENETVHTTTADPLLTNNTVKMVWGEQDKAQPIAGDGADGIDNMKRPCYQLFKHMADNHDLTLLETELGDIVNVVNGMKPATDWDVLRDKFKSFMTHKTAVTISDIGVDAIFNFFKNEINGK